VGRPTVAIITAENQRRYVEGAAAERALVMAQIEDAAAATASLARDTQRRRALSAAATRLVDGRGATRVAEALVAGL
jgi:spore coat polysaccharide biosynthesis predicted glycosyltransferase SpsG